MKSVDDALQIKRASIPATLEHTKSCAYQELKIDDWTAVMVAVP